MNEQPSRFREIFFEVFESLPRQGPGDRDCAARALRLCAGLPRTPMIVDLGCGVGGQTLHLAGLTNQAISRLPRASVNPGGVFYGACRKILFFFLEILPGSCHIHRALFFRRHQEIRNGEKMIDQDPAAATGKEEMMKNVYQRLAEFLDTMPQRFPVNTASGVELRVLKNIFSPDEAEMFMNLKPKPETAAEIAARLKEDSAGLEQKLYEMSRKGLAFRTGREGSYKYMASAFLVGIIEFQMNRMTPELIKEWEEFEPLLYQSTWLKGTTRDLRTIPIGEAVDPDSQVMPYESIEETIRNAKYIAISDCMCRRISAIKNDPCSHPMEVCFHFGGGCHYFVENGLARYISKEEALEIFEKGKESGLVCQVSASQETNALCMCCDCCCGPLRAVKACAKPADMVNSNFFAKVSEDDCTGCELCAERCPMDAICIDDVARVNLDRCIGCGVCAVTCPVEAIKVYRKAKDKEFVPEKTYFDAAMAIYRERRQ